MKIRVFSNRFHTWMAIVASFAGLSLAQMNVQAQLANLSCDQQWYYDYYGINTFTFNGTSVYSGVDFPGISATVGTGNTNMSQSFNAIPGQACTFSIYGDVYYYNSFGLYIDWNNNGSFEANEYIVNLSGVYSDSYSGSFTVPATVTTGPKRMRVDWDFYYAWGYYGFWDPCLSATQGYSIYYGDAEDYTLNIGYANDAAIVNLSTSTPPPFASGLNNIVVNVRNNGVNNINSFVLNYTITPSSGAVITGTASSSTTIAAGASAQVTLVSNYNFPPVGSATVNVSVATVNNTTDGNATNNNGSALFGAGLNGTYTVGGSAPDFTSMSQAAGQLSAGGTIGPVTFNIRPGTYNESVYIGNIPGNSAAKPIVIQSESGNKNSVVLQYSNTPANAATAALIAGTTSIGGTPTIRLNNADYISFKNLTIAATNTAASSGTAVELIGASGGSSGCDNVSFDNIVFNGVASTSFTLGDALFLSVNNGYHTNLSITNSNFNQSSIALYHTYVGSTYPSGDVFTNNVFSNFGAYGMRLEGTNGATVDRNTWTTSSPSLSAGVVFVNHNGAFSFRKNRVSMIVNNGVGEVVCGSRTASGQAIFANNFITVNGTNGIGINANGSTNVGVFHNTVYNATAGAAFTSTSGSSLSTVNNIFYNAGSGPAFSSSSANVSNFNNLYATGTTFALWNGASQASFAAYKSASGQDANSSNIAITFVNPSTNDLSLTTVKTALYGIGSTSNGTFNAGIRNTVGDDIFGNTRNRPEVFMGAHQLIPVITFNPAPPATYVGCANQTLTISANALVTYGADLSFTWQRNGAPLLDGVNGVSGSTTSTLTIIGAQPSLNGGDYVLRVSSTGGSDPIVSNIITVVINSPIQINAQPGSRIMCLGNETSMAVVASGTIFGYQWQKDGKNISGATGPIYVISNAGFQVSGRYRCVLSGTCGTTTIASDDAVVYVASSTLIGRDPEIMGAAVGSTGYLSIEVNATAQIPGYSPQFQWYQGGVMLTDNGRLSGTTTNQLTIRNMQTADIAQNYYCVVTGVCGTQTSKQGGFYVSQISLQNQPQSTEVCTGTDASLLVSATSNIPNVQYSYQWKLNNVPVANGTKYQGATTGVLTIKGAGASEAGDYTCVVTANPTGANLTSNPATISVISSPVVSAQPASKTVCAGDAVSMSVTATGGTLSYQWKASGVSINGATGSSLSIPAADVSMNGAKVTCVISNNCGTSISEEAVLTVNDKPVITTQPSNTSVVIGEGYVLTITANNAVGFQWKKDGTAIPGATLSSYSVTKFTSQMAGSYVCEVTNGCGTVSSQAASLIVSSVDDDAIAAGFSLSNAEPTPTLNDATVFFTMPEAAMARVVLSDVYGREVALVYNGVAHSGSNRVHMDVRQLTNGVYTYTLLSGKYSVSRKMIISK